MFGLFSNLSPAARPAAPAKDPADDVFDCKSMESEISHISDSGVETVAEKPKTVIYLDEQVMLRRERDDKVAEKHIKAEEQDLKREAEKVRLTNDLIQAVLDLDAKKYRETMQYVTWDISKYPVKSGYKGICGSSRYSLLQLAVIHWCNMSEIPEKEREVNLVEGFEIIKDLLLQNFNYEQEFVFSKPTKSNPAGLCVRKLGTLFQEYKLIDHVLELLPKASTQGNTQLVEFLANMLHGSVWGLDKKLNLYETSMRAAYEGRHYGMVEYFARSKRHILCL